jgi:hypothetical protein
MKLEKELTYNQPEIDFDNGFKEINKAIATSKENLKLLKDLARKSLEKGNNVLGGIFGLNVADGRVFYQVTEIKGNTAFVNRCAGICLDLYQDDILGHGDWISLKKATEFVERHRALEKFFGG